MDPKTFGQIALALIGQASFPGTDEAADQIKDFRWTCRALIDGTMVLADPAPAEPKGE